MLLNSIVYFFTLSFITANLYVAFQTLHFKTGSVSSWQDSNHGRGNQRTSAITYMMIIIIYDYEYTNPFGSS